MNNYLFQKNQKIKINESCGSLEQVLFGVPQGSVPGPILHNIVLSDFFLTLNDIGIAMVMSMTTPNIKYATTLML